MALPFPAFIFLFFADILVPNLGMRADVLCQQGSALFGIQVDNLHSQRTQPVESALEVAAFPSDYGSEAELTYQSATVPARRERGDHDELR